MPKRLVLATHNASKQGELRKLFVDWSVDLVPSADLGARPPVEDRDTFIGNAQLKARVTAEAFAVVALGDDGGLVVPSLGGIPGVHSSRWVKAQGGWVAGRERLCELAGLHADDSLEVRATLYCALAFATPDGGGGHGESTIQGRLRWPPRPGHEEYGPGFLPIFEPDDPKLSHEGVLVHRRRAFAQIEAGLRAALGLDH